MAPFKRGIVQRAGTWEQIWVHILSQMLNTSVTSGKSWNLSGLNFIVFEMQREHILCIVIMSIKNDVRAWHELRSNPGSYVHGGQTSWWAVTQPDREHLDSRALARVYASGGQQARSRITRGGKQGCPPVDIRATICKAQAVKPGSLVCPALALLRGHTELGVQGHLEKSTG